jgi:hypothetical protein
MNSIERDVDFCEVCQAVVRDGQEHNNVKHGSSDESAAALLAWKEKLRQTGAHH